jgi:hypothetical protein
MEAEQEREALFVKPKKDWERGEDWDRDASTGIKARTGIAEYRDREARTGIAE